MIKGKPLFALLAGAGVVISTGFAAGVMALSSSSTAQPGSTPHAAIDLADIAANPAASVFLEADLDGRGEMLKSGETAGDQGGKAVVILRISRNQIMYEITWQGMSASAVHLPKAAAGMSGLVDPNKLLNAVPGTINSVLGVVDARMASGLLTKLLTGSAGFKRIGPVDFNRILHVGPLSSVDSGDQEVQQAGDPNGHATVFLGARKTTINFAAIWSGVQSPTALNINKGAVGAVGNLAATLFKAPHGLDPTIFAVAGTVKNVPIKTVTAINARPAAFHTNLITGVFAQGAVRGQLSTPTTTTTTTTNPTMTKPTMTTVMPTTTKTMPTMPTMPTRTTTMQQPPVKPTLSLPTTPGPITHW